MRTRLAIGCCLLALFSGPVLRIAAQNADAIDAPRISQRDFKKLVAAKNVVIVDTRNADAFGLGHIPGAVLLPLEGRLTWLESYEPIVAMLQKTKKPVVTYCAWEDEATSARAALMLKARGVTSVRALRGGWNQWVKDANPVVKGAK